ncbi:MAG TPA: peptidoglycan DD-metalloendopeptidase family protein [Candidatus Paceibacterota bacterium]|nr:peptidoglycan DD-metalloendopeptidase family protein [Candidatus Paceibacterota bacterium]
MRPFGFLFFFGILIGSFFSTPQFVHAATPADIQAQIDANDQQINSLEADIAAFQKQLDALSTKKNTLQSTINSLALSQKQLTDQIQVTQNKIQSTNLKIQQLTLSIGDKESIMATQQNVIANQLRTITESEQIPLIVTLISSNSLGDAWNAADEVTQFSHALSTNISTLQTVRTTLATNRDQMTVVKTNLQTLQNNLLLQKRSIDANKATQLRLLSDTQNKEANYQKLIAEKKASEQSFEQELINLQSQLNLIVHPNLLPKVGTGLLSWPFSNAFMNNCADRKSVFGNTFCITQYFGNTPFSTANPQVYSGHGHDGIDIAAPIGTPVAAALSGTVLATGDTDLVHDYRGRQCYSFGKWVMLLHGNGINTMYAHLSEIDVTKGQSMQTGQVLGLSGMTGYATGPHLHFGVYATEGTKIMTLRQFRGATIGCADASMPVATLSAYLNPLSYL